MNSKYTTGQAVLIPATIESVREENGVIVYEVRANTWQGIPEDAIIVDEQAAARQTYEDEMMKLSRSINERYY
jgi:hypothetical protein